MQADFHFLGGPSIQFIDRVLNFPVELRRRVLQTVQLTAETLLVAGAQSRLSRSSSIPVVTQVVLMVSTVLNTTEFLQLQFIDRVIEVSVVQVQQVLWGSLWGQSRSHSCSSSIADIVVRMPVVAQRQVPNGSDVQKTVKVPQFAVHLNRVVDVHNCSLCAGRQFIDSYSRLRRSCVEFTSAQLSSSWRIDSAATARSADRARQELQRIVASFPS